MLEVEVLVAPGLKHLVILRIVAIAGRLQGLVKVHHIVVEGVVGGEVNAAAKPPHRPRLKVAIVEVHRRNERVAGVQHHRGAGGVEAVARRLGPLHQNRRRQVVAPHFRKIDAALLKDIALLDHARSPAAALGPLPGVLLKLSPAVEGL